MCYSLGTLHSTTSFAHRYFKYYTFSAGLATKITKNLAVHIALLMYLQNIMSFLSFWLATLSIQNEIVENKRERRKKG